MQTKWIYSMRGKPGVKYNGNGVIVTGAPIEILRMINACTMSLQLNGYDASGLRQEIIALKKEMEAEDAQSDNI